MGLHARLTRTPPLPHNWFNMPANLPTALFVRTITFCLALIVAAPLKADVIRQEISPGIVYSQEAIPAPAGPVLVNSLKIDLKRPGVRIKAEIAQDVVFADGPGQG